MNHEKQPTPPRHDPEEYLWDRSGSPDPVCERLEQLLAPRAFDHRARELDHGGRRTSPILLRRPTRLAAAALIVLVLSLGLVWWSTAGSSTPGWRIETAAGTPRAAGTVLVAGDTLRVGQWLETDASSRARVAVADIGTLDVAESSRVRIAVTGPGRHELELPHGRVEASITAPARMFFVHTPAALATDMGCRYTLDIPRDGSGLLSVTLGWVLLEPPPSTQPPSAASSGAIPARVPRGLSCRIDPVAGPGTPFRLGSPAQPIIESFDAREWQDITPEDLDGLLEACNSADAVTLWHALQRVPPEMRTRVAARLRVVSSLPATRDTAALERLDPVELERWWGEVMWID